MLTPIRASFGNSTLLNDLPVGKYVIEYFLKQLTWKITSLLMV